MDKKNLLKTEKIYKADHSLLRLFTLTMVITGCSMSKDWLGYMETWIWNLWILIILFESKCSPTFVSFLSLECLVSKNKNALPAGNLVSTALHSALIRAVLWISNNSLSMTLLHNEWRLYLPSSPNNGTHCVLEGAFSVYRLCNWYSERRKPLNNPRRELSISKRRKSTEYG